MPKYCDEPDHMNIQQSNILETPTRTRCTCV